MPAPEGPTKATVSPARMSRLMLLQHRLVRGVAEGDVLVADIAAQVFDVDRVGGVDDVGGGVEELAVALEAGDALRVGLEDGVDLFDRAEEDADQEEEVDEVAFGQSRPWRTK